MCLRLGLANQYSWAAAQGEKPEALATESTECWEEG